MLSKGRDLVNTAVKLVNGYMNYLKKAGKGASVEEEPAKYAAMDNNNLGNIYPITDNK